MQRLAILICALALGGGPALAQESAYREDLRFLEALRARNESDLALEYLQKLSKNPPPELARELPLEFAKTRLRVANEEPDSGKRLSLYKQAREDFQAFLAANPKHPRAAEANLEIARVLDLQGKTELGRALLSEDRKSRDDQARQARATLEDANKRLVAAIAELRALDEKVTDPAEKKRLDVEITQTELELALNLNTQSQTYLGGVGDEAASKLILGATKLLQPIAGGAPTNPVTWKARAWLGRCLFEIDTADKARAKFREVEYAKQPAAAEGKRLALYFELLVIKDKPTDEEKKGVHALVAARARQWRLAYPNYKRTPEGFGVAFLYAEMLLSQAEDPKQKANRDRLLTDARTLLREVEGSENEFTDRARRLKIAAVIRQGGLEVPVPRLRTFEDCYIRAQYEVMEFTKDRKKERLETIVAALERGLTLPDVRGKGNVMEYDNARAMLAYWLLNTGKYAEAIKVGEGFARSDPRSGQAASAALYALQAYSQLLAKYNKTAAEEAPEERAGMFSLARYMESRWPRELPGDMARHQVGLQLLREENYPEAIKQLATVSPTYVSYPFTQYQLAEAAFKAEKDGTEPIVGDRPGDYRKRAIRALEGVPDSFLGADPATNHITVLAKVTLGNELFKCKRYQDMNSLATSLLGRLDKLTFNADPEKDKATREYLKTSLVNIHLFARYGLADAAAQRGGNAGVVALLDPLVDQVNKGEGRVRGLLQKNTPLATATLSMALRANIQLGKVDRTDAVLDALDRVTAEGAGDAGTTNVLKLLAVLIRKQVDEVRKKGDKDALKKAIDGYSALLGKRTKKQKSLTPEFIRVLADCYSSMGQHDKAAAELGKVPEPKAKPGSEEEKAYRAIQLLYVRELRQSGTAENLKKAAKVIGDIMGPVKPPGWGRSDLFAIKENGLVLEAQGKYRESFAVWSPLVKRLSPRAASDPRMKEHYLECFYHMVYCYLKDGQAKASKEDREEALRVAGLEIARMEKSWEDFGGGASRQRFEELLAKEPALKEQYLAAKKELR